MNYNINCRAPGIPESNNKNQKIPSYTTSPAEECARKYFLGKVVHFRLLRKQPMKARQQS